MERSRERRPSRWSGRRAGKKGLTVVELVVVVFLLSLIAALVFPSFRLLEERSREREARRIASILRYLNDRAVSCKEDCILEVDLRKSTLSWKTREGERKERFSSLKSVSLQSRGEVKEGEVIVLFGPMGMQEGIAFRLGDSRGSTRIEFNPWSGRVKVLTETVSRLSSIRGGL